MPQKSCAACGQAVKRVKAGKRFFDADCNKDTGKLVNYRNQGNLSYHGLKKTFYENLGGTYQIHDCNVKPPIRSAAQWDFTADESVSAGELPRTIA